MTAPRRAAASIWNSSATPTSTDSSTQAVNVGVQFVPSTSGYITGIEFYKATTNTGTHTGSLWSSSGTLLATGTFTNETASGWQTLTFTTPIAVTAGTTYLCRISADRAFLGQYRLLQLVLHQRNLTVPASGSVFTYGTTSAFPTSTTRQQLPGRRWFSACSWGNNTTSPPQVTSIRP